ncbi:MAG TPA: hypothetical protein VE620_03110, partial [Myxococcales bacterium]|nr:hypothetical protein [Myxococcales bacterium]
RTDVALPFELEGELERRIAADSEWQEGIEWGEAERGHPEGAVKNHVADVLASVEREAASRRGVCRVARVVKRGDRGRAEQRARRLVERLGDASPLDLRFFGADNATTEKSPNRPSGSSRWCSKRGRQVWRCS